MRFKHLLIALAVVAVTSLFPPVVAHHAWAADTATAVPAAVATPASPVAAAATPAPAAIATTGYAVNLKAQAGTLIPYIFSAIGAVILPILGWLFGSKGKIKLGDEAVTALDAVINQALAFAQTKTLTAVQGMKDPEVHNQLVATALNFTLAQVPTLIGHLNLTPEQVQAKVAAALDAKTSGISPTGA
ncbi:MAG: hypothetical protein GC185_01785 [Alphaproteobacteria bacterium]|nr:hypothetical protein [Alphaproteobacteria bacterium]